MTTTMIRNMLVTAAFAGVMTSAGSAQEYAAIGTAPLTSDVEKAAKAGVTGTCRAVVQAGTPGATAECDLYNAIADIGPRVPAGKILVVEEASAHCYKATNDPFAFVGLLHAFHQHYTDIPVSVRSTLNGEQWLGGTAPARMYVTAGKSVLIRTSFRLPVTTDASCTVYFVGHLVKQ